MVYFGITDKGIVRKNNQDVFLCEEIKLIDAVLLIVCDGMGGAKSGNIASSMAAEVFRDTFVENLNVFADNSSLAEQMKKAAETANAAVFEKSMTDIECDGMGTTLVAAIVTQAGASIVNVGDSRAYAITKDEGIRQITRDHSIVQDMVNRGDITKKEAKTHPSKNLITRAIGTSPRVFADTFYVSLKEGDRILLCSDGLSNIVDDDQLAYESTLSDDLSECCEALVKAAISFGAPDNVTAALLRI